MATPSGNKAPHHSEITIYAEALSLSLIMLVALIGNLTTVLTILRVPALRQNLHNAFVVNLCIMDLIVCLFSMPFSLVDVFNEGYLLQHDGICRFNCFMALFSLYGNFSGVTLIAVNRCIGIVYYHKVRLRRVHAIIMIACSWVYSFLIAYPTTDVNFSAVGRYNSDTHHCSPDWKGTDIFNIVCIVLLYGVTVPVMVVCHTLIIREIRKRDAQVQKYKHSCHGDGRPKNNRIVRWDKLGIATPPLSIRQCERNRASAAHQRTLPSDDQNKEIDDINALELDGIERNEDSYYAMETLHMPTKANLSIRAVTEVNTTLPGDIIVTHDMQVEVVAVTVGRSESNKRDVKAIESGGRVPCCGIEDIQKRSALETMYGDEVDRDKAGGGESSVTTHGRNANAKLGTDKRVALAGGMLVLTTTLCWAPYYLVHVIVHGTVEKHGIGVFSMWLGYANSALDPIIYSLLNQRIRNAIKRQFTLMIRKVLGKTD